jgi:hypothetical protein
MSSISKTPALTAGALFGAVGALQATGLDWTENAVKTPVQHLTMALYAAALIVVIPAVKALAENAGPRTRWGWIAIAAGQAGVAAASTVSNIRGVDASWFPAVAVAANLAWIVGTFTVAAGLFRSSRLAAIGLVAAYVGAIPLAVHGGGLITGAYWLALATLGGLGRRTLVAATAVVGVALATAAGAGAATTRTLDLAVDGMHATRTFVDAAPKHTVKAPNDSPGDTVVLHAPLVDASGRRVGTVDATFLTTAPGAGPKHDGSEQLTGTLNLADGQLAVLGTVGAFARISHVAIVGGTGRYAGARGDVTAHFSPRAVTLHVSLR